MKPQEQRFAPLGAVWSALGLLLAACAGAGAATVDTNQNLGLGSAITFNDTAGQTLATNAARIYDWNDRNGDGTTGDAISPGGLDFGTTKLFTTNGTSITLSLNGGNVVATGATTNTVALATTRPGACGNVTLTKVGNVTMGTIDTRSTSASSGFSGGSVWIGTSASDRAGTVSLGYADVGNTLTTGSGTAGGRFTVYAAGNVAFSNGVSLVAPEPGSLLLDQSTGNFTSGLIDGRNSRAVAFARTNSFNGGDKSGAFTVSEIKMGGSGTGVHNGQPCLQIQNYSQVSVPGGMNLSSNGGCNGTLRWDMITITNIGAGGVRAGDLRANKTGTGLSFSGNVVIGNVAGGGVAVGAIDVSNGTTDGRAGGNITIYGVTGNVSIASATTAVLFSKAYQTGDLRIGYRVTGVTSAGYPNDEALDPISGNIAITGPIDLSSVNSSIYRGIMKLAATGSITLNSLDLALVKSASLVAPGHSVISNLLSNFVTGYTNGAGTGASPYVTTQQTFRAASGQFIFYNVSSNSYLNAKSYRIADTNGVAGAGGVLRPVNSAPSASNMPVTAVMDTPKAFELIGTDPEGDALTFTTTPPAHGVVTNLPVGSSAVTYYPGPGYTGSDSFDFRVTDGAFTSAWATVTITVQGDNEAPVVQGQAVTTPEDIATNVTFVGSDDDPTDTLTFSIVVGPTNGTLGSITGSNVVYTPTANVYGGDTFTFRAYDGKDYSNTGTVSITISSVNDSPVATSRELRLFWNTPLSIALTGSDVETALPTFAIVANPTRGTLSGAAPSVTYTPSNDFSGVDIFQFSVSDGTLVGTGTVTITVWAPTTWYVDVERGTNAVGNGTYDKPWKTISYAIASSAVTNRDIVKIAGGTYSRATGENGSVGVVVIYDTRSLVLSGGWAFDGGAPWSQRTQTTIIDGANATENVLRLKPVDANTVVEYITIRRGLQAGVMVDDNPVRLSHLVVEGNGGTVGGGIRADVGGVFEYCTITNNSRKDGAGIYMNGSGLIANCVIARNEAPANGGGVYNPSLSGNNVVIFNTLICDNSVTSALARGTALFKSGAGNLYIVNSTIADNMRATGDPAAVGLYFSLPNGALSFRNSILSSNAVTDLAASAARSVVLGRSVFAGTTSNITWSVEGVNPAPNSTLFKNRATADYRLPYESSARANGGYTLAATHVTLGGGAVTFTYVDTDNSGGYTPKLDVVVDVGAYVPRAQEYLDHYIYATTLDEQPRVNGTRIDIGAYKSLPASAGTFIMLR